MLMAPPRLEMLNELAAINENAWDQVLATAPMRTIFQTMAWQRAWWKTFGRGKLLPIAVFHEDQLTAIAPLFADQGMVFFVGSGGSDYLDFIGDVSRPQILQAILELAMAQTPGFLGFRFYHIPDGSPTGRILETTASEMGLTCFDEGSLDAPALRFQDWPADKRLPSEKKSLVRHERTMRKRGQLVVDHFSEYSQIAPLLPTFFEQHIGRWAGTPFPSLFLDEKQREFYYRVSKSVGSRGWLRFSRVSVDGEPVAFHFGFLFQSCFMWYKPSFEITRSHLSPGEVLLRSLLQQAQSESVQVFDFGLGDEAFKQRFATEANTVRTWGLYPETQNC